VRAPVHKTLGTIPALRQGTLPGVKRPVVPTGTIGQKRKKEETSGHLQLDDDMLAHIDAEAGEDPMETAGSDDETQAPAKSSKKSKKAKTHARPEDAGANGKDKAPNKQQLNKLAKAERNNLIVHQMIDLATKNTAKLAAMDEETRATTLAELSPCYTEHSLGTPQELVQTWLHYAKHYGGLMELLKSAKELPDPLEGMTMREAMKDEQKRRELSQFMHVTYYLFPEVRVQFAHGPPPRSHTKRARASWACLTLPT